MSCDHDEPRVCKACADANDPAKLRAELASMRASRDALGAVLKRVWFAVPLPDDLRAAVDVALADHAKGEAS
jgi:hypothetical protein